MKLRHIGQAVLAGAVSLGIMVGIAACGQDNTIDYVYVTNAKDSPGLIATYLVDHRSGTLTPLKQPTISSGGTNPQSIAATANGSYLYVANHDSNTIVEFAIGSDATLTSKNTYTTPGTSPTALTIDSTGTYLFVTDAFQPGFSATGKIGPGALVIYPIKQSDGTLGSPLTDTANGGTAYFPTCNNPVAVSVLNNVPVLTKSPFIGAVYVVTIDPGSQPPKLADTVNTGVVGLQHQYREWLQRFYRPAYCVRPQLHWRQFCHRRPSVQLPQLRDLPMPPGPLQTPSQPISRIASSTLQIW